MRAHSNAFKMSEKSYPRRRIAMRCIVFPWCVELLRTSCTSEERLCARFQKKEDYTSPFISFNRMPSSSWTDDTSA